MSVPEEIRKVQRPTNTVVVDLGGSSLHRYAVRARKGYVISASGKKTVRNGPVVGHIIDKEFQPVQKEQTGKSGIGQLSYGVCAVAHTLSKDLFDELKKIYSYEESSLMMAYAIARIQKPGLTASSFGNFYRTCYLSVYHHDIPTSRNTLGKFIERIGADERKRDRFFADHIAGIEPGHHIAVDGMLKTDTSTINNLSSFSYKARIRGCKEISVLYAYDIEAGEPLVSQVFAGNCVDCRAYENFIVRNHITQGILVDDKGFPPNNIRKVLERHDGLHYLTPIRRNAKIIQDYNMLSFDGGLNNVNRHAVLYRKVQVAEGRFLYAFKDQEKASHELAGYVDRRVHDDSFESEEYEVRMHQAGVIVLESDLDMEPEAAYLCYKARWEIELVFDYYKNELNLDSTNVHNDFSVRGMEFINFISSVITCRIIRVASKAGLLSKMTYGKLIEKLSMCSRDIHAPDCMPVQEDGWWGNAMYEPYGILSAFGLVKLREKVRRGRPSSKKESGETESVPRRRPGRPRTRIVDENAPKRSRGRPRKTVPPEEVNKPKRPRGRPRKEPSPQDETREKRPVGRPRFRPLPSEFVGPKRPRGRPRKFQEADVSDAEQNG